MENPIQPVSKKLNDFNHGLIATTLLLAMAILFLIFTKPFQENLFADNIYFGFICVFSLYNYFLIIKLNKKIMLSIGGLILRHSISIIFLIWLLISLASNGRISSMEFTPVVIITMLYEIHQWLRQLIITKRTEISSNFKKRLILYIVITVVLILLDLIRYPYINLISIILYSVLGSAFIFSLLNIDYALNLWLIKKETQLEKEI